MSPITIQLYSSVECPFDYLATYRLRQVLPEFAGKIQIFWRSLSLEYINQAVYPAPLIDVQRQLLAEIEPRLPMIPWPQADWERPTTYWPAFEALACAQAQGYEATLAYSWALRHAYFAEGRNITLRHELLRIAEQIAGEGLLYYPRFQYEWDAGRWKHTILKENWYGWHELPMTGSPTFVLPDGSLRYNPGVGECEFDLNKMTLIRYNPYEADPLDAYREMFAAAL